MIRQIVVICVSDLVTVMQGSKAEIVKCIAVSNTYCVRQVNNDVSNGKLNASVKNVDLNDEVFSVVLIFELNRIYFAMLSSGGESFFKNKFYMHMSSALDLIQKQLHISFYGHLVYNHSGIQLHPFLKDEMRFSYNLLAVGACMHDTKYADAVVLSYSLKDNNNG
ncbi:hypothetical protein T01_11211 [Trichinella spiralis]|uniref:Uncharacterized protein n=1 Tax=Trichinella spiralis TaxID=6334 RepID=A0A0V1BCX5_TRISP|nr:hypothetical protein T01_11211 [Trichinella spiralis]